MLPLAAVVTGPVVVVVRLPVLVTLTLPPPLWLMPLTVSVLAVLVRLRLPPPECRLASAHTRNGTERLMAALRRR